MNTYQVWILVQGRWETHEEAKGRNRDEISRQFHCKPGMRNSGTLKIRKVNR